MRKFTKASFKSYVKKNSDRLFVKTKSDFDSMTDCVTTVNGVWSKLKKDDFRSKENTLGWHGVWLVGHSRDYFREYKDEEMVGYEVTNCCGRFVIAQMVGGSHV